MKPDDGRDLRDDQPSAVVLKTLDGRTTARPPLIRVCPYVEKSDRWSDPAQQGYCKALNRFENFLGHKICLAFGTAPERAHPCQKRKEVMT